MIGICIAMMGIASPAQDAEPLAPIANQALKDGKDGSINAGFATVLGLSKNQAVPIKRLTNERTGVTNSFSISLADKKTIVFTTRSNQLSTFYLTDLSGKLKRAIVNDGSNKSGGLTNISVATAEPRFQEEKKWWIKKYSP
jgi:hypothetical protein